MSIFNRPHLKLKPSNANPNQVDMFGEAAPQEPVVEAASATRGDAGAPYAKSFKMALCGYCGAGFQPTSWGIRGGSSQAACSMKCGAAHLDRLLPDLRLVLEDREKGQLFNRPEEEDLKLMEELSRVIADASKITRDSDPTLIAEAFAAACEMHARLDAGKLAEDLRRSQPPAKSKFGF